MNFVINAGKAITLFAWILMGYNLFSPFAGDISEILYMLLAVTLVMHTLQTVMLHSLFKSLLPLKRIDYMSVFTFGGFSLMDYRKRVTQANNTNNI